jgi:hypothetical protein
VLLLEKDFSRNFMLANCVWGTTHADPAQFRPDDQAHKLLHEESGATAGKLNLLSLSG